MILELRSGGEGHPGDFAARVGEVLGDDAEVRQPQWTMAFLILGVDASATGEEIRSAICANASRVKVISRTITN